VNSNGKQAEGQGDACGLSGGVPQRGKCCGEHLEKGGQILKSKNSRVFKNSQKANSLFKRWSKIYLKA